MSDSRHVHVSGFETTFRDVRLPFGLVLDAVKISGDAGQIESNPFTIELDRPGRILVTVSEERLTQFLNEEAPGGLREFEVKIEGGKLAVAATAKVIVDIRARTLCSLEIRDGKELWVVLEEVQVLGVGAKGLVEKHLEKMNPVLDLRDFPVSVTMERVTVSEGEIIVIGTLNL